MSSLSQLLPTGRPPGDVTPDATNSSLMSNGGFIVHDLTNKTWGLLTLQVEHRPLFHQSEPTLTPIHIFTSLWPEPRSTLRSLDLSSCVCDRKSTRSTGLWRGGCIYWMMLIFPNWYKSLHTWANFYFPSRVCALDLFLLVHPGTCVHKYTCLAAYLVIILHILFNGSVCASTSVLRCV